MNVLLIEDSAAFAIPIQQELASRGHNSTWIVGAQRLESGCIVGILPDPSADPLGDAYEGDVSRLVEIDPSQYDIALCDGGLCGPVKDGVSFVKYLTALNVPCIAITGGGAGNNCLLDVGAVDGLPKEFVVLALRSNRLNLCDYVQLAASSLPLRAYCDSLRKQMLSGRSSGSKLMLGIPYFDKCA